MQHKRVNRLAVGNSFTYDLQKHNRFLYKKIANSGIEHANLCDVDKSVFLRYTMRDMLATLNVNSPLVSVVICATQIPMQNNRTHSDEKGDACHHAPCRSNTKQLAAAPVPLKLMENDARISTCCDQN